MGNSQTLIDLKAKYAALHAQAAELRAVLHGPVTEAEAVSTEERLLTQRELLLDAARELAQPFSTAQLIVAAWKAYPTTFGLAGYETAYPDANKVIAYVVGRRGMVARRQLTKLGQNLFCVRAAR